MSRSVHVFLDLEDTVVTPAVPSFSLCELLPGNIQKIQDTVRRHVDELSVFTDVVNVEWHLFSFALHNEMDLRNFEATNTREWIESQFGVRFNRIPLLGTDVLRACCRQMHLHPSNVDVQEVINFWGKQLAFQLWMADNRRAFTGSDVFLFDDTVRNSQLVMFDDDIFINFVSM